MTDFISASLLSMLAYIYAPSHPTGNLEGGVTDEVPVYTTGTPPVADTRPCLIIAQMSGSSDSRIGAIPTGKYQILFHAGVTIKENYIIVSNSIRFKVDTFAAFATHVEAVLTKLPARTK